MIDLALAFIQQEVNAYLHTRTGEESKVVLDKLIDESGKYNIEKGKLGLSLINIEEERVFRSQLPEYQLVDGKQVLMEPPVKLTIYFMLAANITLYSESLKFIGHVAAYFQANNGFTPAAYPGLDERIENMTVELQSLGYEQQNQLWAYLGGKYLPSLVYKARMVVIQDTAIKGVGAPITEINEFFVSK